MNLIPDICKCATNYITEKDQQTPCNNVKNTSINSNKNANEEMEDIRLAKSMTYSYSLQLWYPLLV